MMTDIRTLRGSCSCGRNNYVIAIPCDDVHSAHISFDNTSESRRAQAAPLTAWLRVPLTWYRSHTTSFFPDETHAMIRKTFTSSNEPQRQRKFCGFCGTHLTHWGDTPPDEAGFISVTVGSLFGEDLRQVEELGLIEKARERLGRAEDCPYESQSEHEPYVSLIERDRQKTKVHREGATGELEWMEELITGSRLGWSSMTRKGTSKHLDGTRTIEWEVTEITDDGTAPGPAKRKVGDATSTPDTDIQL